MQLQGQNLCLPLTQFPSETELAFVVLLVMLLQTLHTLCCSAELVERREENSFALLFLRDRFPLGCCVRCCHTALHAPLLLLRLFPQQSGWAMKTVSVYSGPFG